MVGVCAGQIGRPWAREELNLRPLPCQIQRAITAVYSGRSRNVKDGRKAAAKNKRKGMDAPTIRHAPPAITSVPSTVGCCPYAAATAEPLTMVGFSGPAGERKVLVRARVSPLVKIGWSAASI